MKSFTENPRLDVFKSYLVNGAEFNLVYEFPLLSRTDYKPKKAVPFAEIKRKTDIQQWIHFYSHDYRFECIWNNPRHYLPMFQRFEGVITPDYSLYRELPLAMQIWNTYRSRALAYWLQSNGIKTVPNVRWGDERTYSFAFEGLPCGGTIAVSTNGCIQDKIDRVYFKAGLAWMVEALRPQTIVNYSQTPEEIFGKYREQGIEVIAIEHYQQTLRRAVD